MGARPEYKPYNRYRDIMPCTATRVVLGLPSLNADPQHDYINANLVTLPLVQPAEQVVLTQGPMANTAAPFWQMVLQLRVCTIVMLTDCVEGGRAKCDAYWPALRLGQQQHGPVAVQNIDVVVMGPFTVSTLVVSNSSTGQVCSYA